MSHNKRNPYFDFLRAFAIIMVIGNHTSSFTNLNMANGFNMNVLILQIMKCAVPIFLAISGYFLCNVTISNNSQYYSFLKKHLIRIYLPMMIFSLPYIFGNGFVIRSIIGRTILALLGAYSVYYFIFLIAQYYVFLPIIAKLVKNHFSWIFIVLSTISILVDTYLLYIKGMDIPLFVYAGIGLVWIAFFALGCYLRIIERTYKLTNIVIFTFFSLALSYLETLFLNTEFSGGYGIKLSVFLFSGCTIILLFSEHFEESYNRRSDNIIFKFLSMVGRISFPIYLCHVYIIQFLDTYNLFTDSWLINIILVTAISITMTLLTKWILPKRLYKLIGL